MLFALKGYVCSSYWIWCGEGYSGFVVFLVSCKCYFLHWVLLC